MLWEHTGGGGGGCVLALTRRFAGRGAKASILGTGKGGCKLACIHED